MIDVLIAIYLISIPVPLWTSTDLLIIERPKNRAMQFWFLVVPFLPILNTRLTWIALFGNTK